MKHGDIQEMAFTSDLVAMTLRWLWFGQQMQTKRYFVGEGAAYFAASPEQLGEAYWNHVKGAWRALTPNNVPNVFQSILIEEVGGALSFGEYSIPTGDRTGTRAEQATYALATYNAVGVRYSVGTRLTRPGQMRVPFLFEGDVTVNNVDAPFLALTTTLATLYADNMALGAPVATGVLRMNIVRMSTTEVGVVVANQPVVGFTVNSRLTTQVSRKEGRGS